MSWRERSQPVSVRNNNPGNMRPVGSTEGFQVFTSPQEGLDAMRKDLLIKVTGQSKAMNGKVPTLANIISTWAPPSENNTQGYIQFVSNKTGIDPNTVLHPSQVDALLPAMIEQEGGKKAVDYYFNGSKMAAPQTNWRERAQPVTAQTTPASGASPQSDWRSRAQPAGQDMGQGAAVVQGYNSAVPFGERAAAGIGAGIAYGYDKLTGLDAGSFSDYYNEGRDNQKATAAANPGSYLAGAGLGIAATLPAVSAKAIGGTTAATTGIRGGINAVPQALANVGNWVRGSQAATSAGTIAKTANLAGKAARSAAVAAPAGALYGYGASENRLDSAEAVQDAASGAKLAAGVGAAVPVAGAAINKVIAPKLDEATRSLAKRAKDFGIDLSLDQLSPTRVRNTVQKISQNLPGSGVDAFQDKQSTQWLRGVAKTIGQDSDNLGPETINKFLDDANTGFEAIVKHTDIKTNPRSVDALKKIVDEAKGNITADYANLVKGKAEKLANELFKVRNVKSGLEYSSKPLNGKKLASIRSKLVKELPNVAGDARKYVADMVDYIDDIAEKNLAKADVVKLGEVRRQWRNFKTLEPLLEKSTDGRINPTELMGQVAKSKYIKASRKNIGDDDLVDLAKIGKKFLVKKGGSDTVPNALISGGAANLAMVPFAPAVALPMLGAQGATYAANSVYQKLINQSPKVVERAIRGKGSQVPQMLSAVEAANVGSKRLGTNAAVKKLPAENYRVKTSGKVFYHGGEPLTTSGKGVTFFTDDPKAAKKYVDEFGTGEVGSRAVQKAQLNTDKIATEEDVLKVVEELRAEGKIPKNLKAPKPAYWLENNIATGELGKVTQRLKELGYEAAEASDKYGKHQHKTIAVFDRKNIKPIKEK